MYCATRWASRKPRLIGRTQRGFSRNTLWGNHVEVNAFAGNKARKKNRDDESVSSLSSLWEIVADVNAKYLQKNEKLITNSTVERYVKAGNIGTSLVKAAALTKYPPELMNAAQLDMKMAQLPSEKTRFYKMKAILGAISMGTEYADMSPSYCWRKLRKEHCEEMRPTMKSFAHHLHNQHTVWQGINDWFIYTKHDIVKSGLAMDEKQLLMILLLCSLFKTRTNNFFGHSTRQSTQSVQKLTVLALTLVSGKA